MLGLQKSVALRNLLVILDRVDIDIAQLADLVLDGRDHLLHRRKIRVFLVAELHRCMQGQLILLPHVIVLILVRLLQLFTLAVQTENLLVQIGDLLGDVFALLEKSLVFRGHFFPARRVLLQCLLQLLGIVL